MPQRPLAKRDKVRRRPAATGAACVPAAPDASATKVQVRSGRRRAWLSVVSPLLSRWLPSRARCLAICVLVAVAYHAGAHLGFLLTYPTLKTSVLWPPNAILTATLLLAEPRRWWPYLLAAFPAHLAVQLPQGLPTSLILLWFLTNCSEAIIAAVLVRRLAPAGRVDFHSLRGAGTFIVCAGLAAPFGSSFLDAAAASALRGDDYWLVWRARFFANVLTELTVVPPIVMGVTGAPAWTRGRFRERWREALALGVSLSAVSLMTWRADGGADGVTSKFPLAVSLPFLAWAAMRLGPAATSAAMLIVELVAVTAGIQARGPFADVASLENAISLQIVLVVVTIPLMCFAALIEEHERTQLALQARLTFEETLSGLARAFIHLPSDEIDAAIHRQLRELGRTLGIAHIRILQLSPAGERFVPTHSWTSQSSGSAVPPVTVGGEEDRELTLMVTDECVLSVGPLGSGEPWPPEMVPQLRLVAEVFSNAIARKNAEEALRGSASLNTAILRSLTSAVAVLDRGGRVVALNAAWRRFSVTADGDAGGRIGVGASAQELCRYALAGTPFVDEALAGIRIVMEAQQSVFAFEYARRAAGGEQWFALAVVPLNRTEGGVVVSVADVTERRRMEIEMRQRLLELAHVNRVSTVGELTASLAHELNQPLAAILANAQVAQRLLAVGSPDLDEVRAALADIVADDRRASEVIGRLRQLLRKDNVQRVPLDLNVLIREVTKLVATDAVMRNVAIELDLDPALPLVPADRVQMQQVLLNLLVNALEAVSSNNGAARAVTVGTARAEDGSVHVTVSDTGPGLLPDATAAIFEPFYTTKPGGMGMGLSIARTILEAAGGRIWASNNPAGGATFHFTVPGLSDRAA